MRIDFRQGIITHPIAFGGQQQFLAKVGSYINLQTANGRTDITFAHGTENYLHSESSDVANAWGPLSPNTDYWLYWDIHLRTAVRSFGITTIQPQAGSIQPTGVEDLHWFNTSTAKMYVFKTGRWHEVIRLFAAKVNNNTISGLGSGTPSKPFIGTQVGLLNNQLGVPVVAGRIIADNTGMPIRKVNGQFFSSEDDFFVNGSPVNVIRLEANIVHAAANQNIAKYQMVKYTDFDRVSLADYNDVGTTMLAMCMEDLLSNEVGTLCVQGVITNPNWNFQTVGVNLWISSTGLITEDDPHITDPPTYPETKVPIGRVLSKTSIFLDQTFGGKGDKGDPGISSPLATTTVYGIAKLSVAAADVHAPIVVGTNDPRLIPYVHPLTHPSTMITTDVHGMLTGATANDQLHQLADRNLDSISNVIVPNPASNDYLKFNGTHWVNSPYVPALTNITLTGDVTGTGTSSILTTLATVNSSPGTHGSNVAIPVVTVNSKGLVTNISTAAVSVGDSLPSQTGNSGKFLTTNGTVASWGSAPLALDDLSDVVITTPATDQILKYNGTNWVNAAGGGGGGGVTVVDDNTNVADLYLTFTATTSGPASTLNVATTKLKYNPLSGTIYSTNFHSTSDERLKTNIYNIVDGVGVIKQITGVGFNWKDTGIKSFGVIAQQIEQIIPEIVHTSSDGSKSVEYDAIIAFLIEAVKELSIRLESVENR